MDYDRMFAQFEALPDSANVNAVFGAPVAAEGKLVIPVASVNYMFGLGMGEGQGPQGENNEPTGSGGGGGGGGRAQAKPVAVIEVTAKDTRIEGVVDEQLIALAGIAFAAWAIFWIANAIMRIFGKRG